jgi:hypothetical protein
MVPIVSQNKAKKATNTPKKTKRAIRHCIDIVVFSEAMAVPGGSVPVSFLQRGL